MTRTVDAARFARVKELFGAVVGLPHEEGARILAEQCGPDVVLRREVEDLLAHAARAGTGFLAGTADASLDQVLQPTVQVPGFTLGPRLAAGASGLVHRAVQETPRREVAVKLLRLDTLGPGQVARFRREAEILARLSHPGIAQVFGAGVARCDAGELPWIAMELVDGRDLATWLDDERPGVRARVELFAALCDAVEHAHERGFVHRDLKPSNVLVTADGRPKVIDFGIARDDEDGRATGERTRTGLVLGTLSYMAPEQARGDPDAVGPASDVYALGVMLFEALAGELPLDLETADVLEGARIVCEGEPLRLRALVPGLPLDLENVLVKALEKDPRRRYASAGALGADLANWLADRPVVARRPTLAYQLRKFVRRNRGLTVGTAVVFLSLVVALLQARGRLLDERRGNERLSSLTETLSSKYFGLTQRLGFGAQDRRDAEQLIGLIEAQIALDPGYRPLRALLARALNDLGELHQSVRSASEAAVCFARALELREALAVEDPDDRESRSHASRLCAKLGEVARDRGDLEGRDRWFAEALARDEALVARFPDDPELREDLGWSLDRVASAAVERGDEETALRLRLRRLADAEELVRRWPDDWKLVRNLSHVHYFLIGIGPRSDHLTECVRLARREVELRPGSRDALAWLVHAERAAHRHAPDLRAELAPGQAAWESALRLAREDPARQDHLVLLRLAGTEAVSMYLRMGRHEAARQVLAAMRERIDVAAAVRGLESFAGLLRTEIMLWEVRLLTLEGRPAEARELEELGWGALLAAAPAELGGGELELCRDVLSVVALGCDPYPAARVESFFGVLLAAGMRERARWFAEELARPDRLPQAGILQVNALRDERGF